MSPTLAGWLAAILVGLGLGIVRTYRDDRAHSAKVCEQIARKVDRQLAQRSDLIIAQCSLTHGIFRWDRQPDGSWLYVSPWRRLLRAVIPNPS